MKGFCADLNQSIAELVKVRKAVFEKKAETKQMKVNENHFFTELRKEMFELDLSKLADFVLPELSCNVQKFRYLMDLIDSFNFNLDLKKSVEFDPVEELEIEQIKTISNLKDTIRNQKFILDHQNKLLKSLTRYEEVKYDPEKVVTKISEMSLPGIEQQKSYLSQIDERIKNSVRNREGLVNRMLSFKAKTS